MAGEWIKHCLHLAMTVHTGATFAILLLSRVANLPLLLHLQLAIAERLEREADERHRGRKICRGDHQHSPRDKGGGLLGAVPPDMRRAALNLIDYQLTPVLVDQWRCAQRCFLMYPSRQQRTCIL